MSSQDTSGSNLGGINQQQIAELMQTLGAGKTAETKEVKTEKKLPHEKDTSAKSEGKAERKEGPDSGKPVLFPPITAVISKKGTKQQFTEQAAELNSTATLTKTEEAAEQVKAFAQDHPGVKLLLKLTGSEAKAYELLNKALDSEGVSGDVTASHPKLPSAVKKALAIVMEEKGINLPETKAELYGNSLEALKTITTYSEFIQTIDPAGKSYNHGDKLEKVVGMVGSAEELVGSIVDQLKIDPNVPESERRGILEFLQFISKLISELKQVLIEMHIKDSKGAGAVGRQTVEATDEKRKYINKQFEIMREKMRMKKHADYVQKVMKILTPIMSGLMILTSLVFLPVAPIVTVIMITIAVTQLAAMTALTETGAMTKIFEELNKIIESVGEKVFKKLGIDYESAGDLSKVLFWGILLTGLVAATLLLTFMPYIGVMIPMVAMPIITTIMTESKLFDLLVEALQHVTGIGDKLRMILTGVVTMVFTLVITLVVELATALSDIIGEIVRKVVGTVFTGGLSVILEFLMKIMKGVLQVVRTVVQAIALIVKTFMSVLKIVFKALKTLNRTIKNVVNMTNDALAKVKQTIDKVLAFIKEVLNKIKTAFKKLGEFIDDLKDVIHEQVEKAGATAFKELKKIDNLIDNIKDKMEAFADKAEKFIQPVSAAMHMSGQTMQMSANAISQLGLGAITKRMAKLTEEEGEIDYMIKLLAELIKALEALMAKLQGRHEDEGVGEFMKQVNELSSLFEQIIASMTGITDEVAASAVV